jgi:hypothetical protein
MNEEFIVKKVSESLSIVLKPDPDHEFLMSSKEVAKGYGISAETLRSHKRHLGDDLTEGKHFISSVPIKHGAGHYGASLCTMYTKRGILRIGFTLRSERAKVFRDWVEDLVIGAINQKVTNLPDAPRRNHNRLTADRIIDLMADICRVEDNELRLSLLKKVLPEAYVS